MPLSPPPTSDSSSTASTATATSIVYPSNFTLDDTPPSASAPYPPRNIFFMARLGNSVVGMASEVKIIDSKAIAETIRHKIASQVLHPSHTYAKCT